MKIGILTYHRSINNGALIQCYSLAKRVQADFPNDSVEVIDYEMPKVAKKLYPDTLKLYYADATLRMFLGKTKKLLLNPLLLRRNREKSKSFKAALSELPLSSRKITSDDTKELFQYINETYDVVIAGSDAIWNYIVRGFPNPYFLDTSIEIPKFSYAASCYGMEYEKLPVTQKTEVSKILNSYVFVGTRDSESENFIKEIGSVATPTHTCDPTILLRMNELPVNKKELEEKLKSRGFTFDRETIGIMGNESMCSMVRKIYGDKYRIVALYNYCKGADVQLYDINPYEWAYVFRYFKITFTTYFHGTLLSLKNNTPVICIALTNEYNRYHVSKAQDFLKRVGMENCYFETDYEGVNFDKIKEKADELIGNKDKTYISQAIEQEAMTYGSFYSALKDVLDGSKK